MTTEKALLLIRAVGTEDRSQLMELWEDAVFEINTYFFRRPFIPKLAMVKSSKLDELHSAGISLGFVTAKEQPLETTNPYDQLYERLNSIPALIRTYNEEESRLKTALSNTSQPKDAMAIYLKWIGIYTAYAQAFTETYEKEPFAVHAIGDLKLSDTINDDLLMVELDNQSALKPELLKLYSRLKKTLI